MGFMVCPVSNSRNVFVTREQVSAKTRGRGMGCLWALGRLFMIFCTCGLWLLIGRRNRTGKTKFKYKTVAICQECGHRWYV